jgi:hypothetical protein
MCGSILHSPIRLYGAALNYSQGQLLQFDYNALTILRLCLLSAHLNPVTEGGSAFLRNITTLVQKLHAVTFQIIVLVTGTTSRLQISHKRGVGSGQGKTIQKVKLLRSEQVIFINKQEHKWKQFGKTPGSNNGTIMGMQNGLTATAISLC